MSRRSNNLALDPEATSSGREEAVSRVCKNLHTSAPGAPSRCHVLFIIDELCEIGGAERVLFKMIRSLPDELFRCSLITFRINDEVDLNAIGCPVYVMPLRRTFGWNALRVARQIRRFIREEEVSIVHTFFETSDLWAGPVAKFGQGVALVSSRRDLGILRSSKHRLAYRLLRGFYDSVLAVSPQVREFCIREDRLNPSRVRTLFNGVDLEAMNGAKPASVMRRELGIPDGAPVITTVGNIRHVKGIDVMVEAAARVSKTHPDAVFLVVGRKSEEQHCRDLEARISSLGLTENFRLLGSREDVFSILRMSDIFCLPSRSEGFSNALIEAMACALPCVATDVGGNREVITDGESGLLVPCENEQQLANALLQVLADPARAREMGRRGEQIVHARFTVDAMMGQLIGIYQGLISSRRAQ